MHDKATTILVYYELPTFDYFSSVVILWNRLRILQIISVQPLGKDLKGLPIPSC